jgi:hypothetical protein
MSRGEADDEGERSPLEVHPAIAGMVRAVRLFLNILAAGLALFLGIAAWLQFGLGHDTPPEGAGMLTNVALVVGGALILAMGFFRLQKIRAALTAWVAGDAERFRQLYAQAVLRAASGISTGGYLLGVAFLVEKDPMTLTAAALCLLLILSARPSVGRVEVLLAASS